MKTFVYVFVRKIFLSLEPVKLTGEFQFNLQSLKEINVSDSFLGLDVTSRKCQNIETYNDCKTRHYIKNMTQVCGCLPLSHIMSEEVCNIYIYFLIFNIFKKDVLCTTKEEIECSKTLTVSSKSCMRS